MPLEEIVVRHDVRRQTIVPVVDGVVGVAGAAALEMVVGVRFQLALLQLLEQAKWCVDLRPLLQGSRRRGSGRSPLRKRRSRGTDRGGEEVRLDDVAAGEVLLGAR